MDGRKGNPMNQKIALVSLVPDTGHVLPLLRLGMAFVEKQYEVRCFLPQECAAIIKGFNLSVEIFGKVTNNVDRTVFNHISKRSVFYNAFSCYKDVELKYLYPLAIEVISHLDKICDAIQIFDPALIVVDDNLLPQLCKYLAAYLNRKLVFHISGSNCSYSNRYDRKDYRIKLEVNGKSFNFNYQRFLVSYGFTHYHPILQQPILQLSRVLEFISRRILNVQSKHIKARCNQLIQKKFSFVDYERVEPLYINTGLAFIEREMTKDFHPGGSQICCFPPIPDQRCMEISPDLLKWIEAAGEKPVIYICLGTMVQGYPRLIRQIIGGLKELDIFILWSAPSAQVGMIKAEGHGTNLRVENFLPQAQVLALEKVRCFITHGGAGGVQDGLLNGKPMLCIPFIFDQPFNSSIVEILQVGIKLWKKQVTAKSVQNAVAKILEEPSYGNVAREWMGKLRTMDGGGEIIRLFKELNYLEDNEVQ